MLYHDAGHATGIVLQSCPAMYQVHDFTSRLPRELVMEQCSYNVLVDS